MTAIPRQFPMPGAVPIDGVGAPPTNAAWEAAFGYAASYDGFLERHATDEQRARWRAVEGRVVLTPDQSRLLASFTRRMPVLVLAGAWCGDCVNQCPIFARFAAATPSIVLRFLDRDAIPSIAAHLRVCGGQRVPVVAFFSEDFTPVHVYGDRTLSAYRTAAAHLAGTSCPTGLAPPAADTLAVVTGEWLEQFERVQWLLRLSGRLRQLHGD
ncbi:MAG: thioredoxin family protein [Planctomycetaceae bacterium]